MTVPRPSLTPGPDPHGRAVLRELIERVGRIDIIGTPEWTTNSSLRGLARMQVMLVPLS